METWKRIAGYDYKVSDLGRVLSLSRLVRAGRGNGVRVVEPVILKPSPNHNGYLHVTLGRDGKNVTRRVAHLVLETFVGPRPEGMQACHNNGVVTDNRLVNLRWDTRTANQRDRLAHGTWRTKLTEAQVLEIRANPDIPSRRMASKFGVSKAAILDARAGVSWTHLPLEAME